MRKYVSFDVDMAKNGFSKQKKPAKLAKVAKDKQKQGVKIAKPLLNPAKALLKQDGGANVSNGLANVSKTLANTTNCNKSTLASLATLAGQTAAKVETNRPNWCTLCAHGRYENDKNGSPVLWCSLTNRAVLEMKKCVKGYWVKNKKGFPLTVH